MKKFFLLAAAFCAALSIHAAAVDLDLSRAQSYSSAGSASLSYSEADGVLTVNWTVSAEWEVTGVKIPLRSLTGITGLQFDFQGDGSEVDFLHYLTDEQGTNWWDANGWFDLSSSEWQSASLQ